jgi:hypothetical protein
MPVNMCCIQWGQILGPHGVDRRSLISKEHTMAQSSLMGGERAPEIPEGRSVARLGPSNSSDSGSDASAGAGAFSDSDAAATGERASADDPSKEAAADADVLPDQVVGTGDAPQTRLRPREARQLAQEQARAVDA